MRRIIFRRFSQTLLCCLVIRSALPLFLYIEPHNDFFDKNSKKVNHAKFIKRMVDSINYQAVMKHVKWNDNLLLRVHQHTLPYSAKYSASLETEQNLCKRNSKKPLMVMGVPTVKKKNRSY